MVWGDLVATTGLYDNCDRMCEATYIKHNHLNFASTLESKLENFFKFVSRPTESGDLYMKISSQLQSDSRSGLESVSFGLSNVC